MNRCTRCILPETFPGIKFNKEGVCNYCREYKGQENLNHKKMEYRKKFQILVDKYKGKSDYDALLCYSGGKDSTYTSILLKNKYKLNILALTFDNGFVSEQAFHNIKNVVENLGIDHVIVKPRFDILKKVFRVCKDHNIYSFKSIERASAICTSCMGLVKFCALRTTIEKNIPFIAYGWSPGQAPITSSIMKNNPQMLKMMQRAIFEPLYQIAGDAIKPYFLEERHYNDPYQLPYNIHPLSLLDYNEKTIYKTISKYGWEAPRDTDANSTNCLLNSYANIVHKKQFHFHPYSLELANLVREGYLNRDLAIERIEKEEDPEVIAIVQKKLGLK